jgi:hypothetical protein
VLGLSTSLHYVRTKEGAEVDFVLCEADMPSHLIECKHADNRPAAALRKLSQIYPEAQAIQLVRELRQEEYHRPIHILKGANWLATLAA